MRKEGKISNVIKLILEYIVTISFVMSTFVNVISFYLTGNSNELIRKVISQGLTFIITLYLVTYVIYKWSFSNTKAKKNIFLCFVPLAINGIFVSWGSYCVALVCSAIYIKAEGRFEQIISKMKYVAGIMLPFWCVAIYYYGGLHVTAIFSKGIGGLTHLSIGYTAVIVYSFLICDFAILVHKKKSNNILHYFVIILEIIMCSLVAVMSGGRGALLAWGGTSIVALIMLLIKKERKAISCILAGGVAIIIFCVIAPADNASLNRQFSFIAEIKNGDVTRSLWSEESEKLLSEIYNKADEQQEISDIVKEISNEQKNQVEPITDDKSDVTAPPSNEQTDEQYQDAIYSVTNGSMARIYLWKLALKEMRQKPILGLGPVGYYTKYKTYPHNIFLECLSDFGFPIGILFIGCCGGLAILIIKYSFEKREYMNLIIILCGVAIRAMLSGSLYSCEFLLFAFAIVIWQLTDHPQSVVNGETEKNNS